MVGVRDLARASRSNSTMLRAHMVCVSPPAARSASGGRFCIRTKAGRRRSFQAGALDASRADHNGGVSRRTIRGGQKYHCSTERYATTDKGLGGTAEAMRVFHSSRFHGIVDITIS